MALAIVSAASLIDSPHPARGGINVWTSRGPENTVVLSLAAAPTTPTTLYAGTDGGGVFKGVGGVDGWNAVNEGLPADAEVVTLAIDPQARMTLYAVILGSGVFKTTNGGGTWSATGLGAEANVSALIVDPLTPTTLYASSASCEPGCAGVVKSTDAGDTWSAINTGLTTGEISALAINPIVHGTLYAGTSDHGLFKSTDAGGTWNVTALTSPVLDPTANGTLYVETFGSCPRGCLLQVTKSTDGASTWNDPTPVFVGNSQGGTLALDPAISTALYIGQYAGVYKSIDGGATWNALNAGLTNADVRTLAFDPASPTHVYVGTADGVFEIEALCGTGSVDTGEECDDGNLVNADGCEADCTLPRCANGILDFGEECDDGNDDSGDGCDADCTLTRCGNGIVTPPEECDDADRNATGGCTAACTICGNGVTTPPEQCDDGNLDCGDGCTPDCQHERSDLDHIGATLRRRHRRRSDHQSGEQQPLLPARAVVVARGRGTGGVPRWASDDDR